MKAIGYTRAGDVDVLSDISVETPVPGPRDLLVAVKAVSVNPVDTKVRGNAAPTGDAPKILGYDAAGIVQATGSDVSLFKVGDEVFYSGSIDRQGANAEFHLVDERIVGRKPATLSFGEAAALPLTALTAWELLFDRLRVPYGAKTAPGALLIINGAGGVGSILIQLARRLTGLTVIATASRPETKAWVEQMGAHHCIDHHAPIDQGVRDLGIAHVDYVAGLTGTDVHLAEIAEIIAPQGHLSLIDDVALDIGILKPKSVSVTWEMVFTRPLFGTADMIAQHHILNEVSALVDAGVLRTTLTEEAGPITAANLRAVHRKIEQGKTIGKVTLSGFA
ncbi:MAG TPA: zinc-binding alcohol dehydrogenase family protein [Sphingobium sp.]